MENLTSEQQICLHQLGYIYGGIEKIYEQASSWTNLLLAADAVLLSVGVEQKSQFLVILGSVALFVLAYQMNRIGQTIGGLTAVAFAIENELNIPMTYSPLTAFLVSFRNKTLFTKLKEFKGIDDDNKRLEWLGRSSDYSVFAFRRSNTVRAAVIVGTIQFIAGIVLF